VVVMVMEAVSKLVPKSFIKLQVVDCLPAFSVFRPQSVNLQRRIRDESFTTLYVFLFNCIIIIIAYNSIILDL